MTHFTPREKLGQKIGRLPDRRQRPVPAFAAALRTAVNKIPADKNRPVKPRIGLVSRACFC